MNILRLGAGQRAIVGWQMLGGSEHVGVAPDAPLAVGSAAKDGEGVAGALDGLASCKGRDLDFEEIPADGKIAVDGDLLHVGADFDADCLRSWI